MLYINYCLPISLNMNKSYFYRVASNFKYLILNQVLLDIVYIHNEYYICIILLKNNEEISKKSCFKYDA